MNKTMKIADPAVSSAAAMPPTTRVYRVEAAFIILEANLLGFPANLSRCWVSTVGTV